MLSLLATVKMFVASQWNNLTFFGASDVDVDGVTSTLQKKLSLAESAQGSSKRNNFDLTKAQKFIVRNDYSSGTNDQKRQKNYDYTEEYCFDFVNCRSESRGKTVYDIIHSLPNGKPHCATPQFFFHGIEAAFVKLACIEARLPKQPYWRDSEKYPRGIYLFLFNKVPIYAYLGQPRYSYAKFRELYVLYSDKMASQDATLFEETFTIININDEKYDRVSRLSLESEDLQTAMTLDVNTELYPCNKGEKLQIMLATSLALDGSKEEKGWRDVGRTGQDSEATLADMYDYVCHGKLYKFEDGDDETMFVSLPFVLNDWANFGIARLLSPLEVC